MHNSQILLNKFNNSPKPDLKELMVEIEIAKLVEMEKQSVLLCDIMKAIDDLTGQQDTVAENIRQGIHAIIQAMIAPE